MDDFHQNLLIRKANLEDTEMIWEILQQAIVRRRSDNSTQWQNGYPNEETVIDDIENGVGFVFTKDHQIAGYAAIIFDIEPAYEIIEGKWLTQGKYAVIHRVAISEQYIGRGLATKIFVEIENYVRSKNIKSIKVDTNFDNIQMLKILERLNYQYCGEVYFRESARKAFEKILFQ